MAILLKNMKVMKDKERLRNCFRLKETEQTGILNALIQCYIPD